MSPFAYTVCQGMQCETILRICKEFHSTPVWNKIYRRLTYQHCTAPLHDPMFWILRR